MVVTVETTSERSETESIVRRTRSKGWSCKTRHRKIRNSGRSRFFFVMNARIHISHCAPIVLSPSVSPFSTILRLFSLSLFFSSSLIRSFRFDSTVSLRFSRMYRNGKISGKCHPIVSMEISATRDFSTIYKPPCNVQDSSRTELN